MKTVELTVAGLADGRQSHLAWRAQAAREALRASCPHPRAWDAFLQRLEKAGLGEALRSWAGAGPPQRVSPAHLRAALGGPEVQRIAGRAGLTEDELVAELSQSLPEIVAQRAWERRRAGGESSVGVPRRGRADRRP